MFIASCIGSYTACCALVSAIFTSSVNSSSNEVFVALNLDSIVIPLASLTCLMTIREKPLANNKAFDAPPTSSKYFANSRCFFFRSLNCSTVKAGVTTSHSSLGAS